MFFRLLLLLILFQCVAGTLESNVLKSVDLIIKAAAETKTAFCLLLAGIIYNYSLFLTCRKLAEDGSDEYPNLIDSSKTKTSWYGFLLSINDKFVSYPFFM
jgi:hypothetical protein